MRDYYVWSDTDQKYPDARIIFTDTEPSNWTWDPVARQYYWHRFFSNQPDLNFDNPAVQDEMSRILRFWLDKGVDGLRLDAIPYLFEREGTNCENLPEDARLPAKRVRAEIDAHYADRMLLAEANQWPPDVRPYFGDGDECHMAFHFPLMPRIYMALRKEVRTPIVEILAQTPEIPTNCQWGLFLRNHDELTLEMVTDDERDYMYTEYANDPRMRVNIGIRRRLAPLLDNSRRRQELLHSLLFSMPGTPILYYGDEIGMGDNIYLGDRNGVRTPMQWNGDRNAGFSRADPQALYLPLVIDPVYHYQSINVEAQRRVPSSLLNWMRRLIAIRKRYPVFGRGAIEFLHPSNLAVLAYLRLRRGPDDPGGQQPVALRATRRAGPERRSSAAYPSSCSAKRSSPGSPRTPYFLSLGPHTFYWFRLDRPAGQLSSRVSRRTAPRGRPGTGRGRRAWSRGASGVTSQQADGEEAAESTPRNRAWARARGGAGADHRGDARCRREPSLRPAAVDQPPERATGRRTPRSRRPRRRGPSTTRRRAPASRRPDPARRRSRRPPCRRNACGGR